MIAVLFLLALAGWGIRLVVQTLQAGISTESVRRLALSLFVLVVLASGRDAFLQTLPSDADLTSPLGTLSGLVALALWGRSRFERATIRRERMLERDERARELPRRRLPPPPPGLDTPP